MADVAVAAERQALVQGLRRGVLFGLEAGEDRPGDGEDPEEPNEPRERTDARNDCATLADAQLRPTAFLVGHASSSSLNRLERTRSANVAMMIEKMTTTIAYAEAEP